jgi:hypothetical protein
MTVFQVLPNLFGYRKFVKVWCTLIYLEHVKLKTLWRRPAISRMLLRVHFHVAGKDVPIFTSNTPGGLGKNTVLKLTSSRQIIDDL